MGTDKNKRNFNNSGEPWHAVYKARKNRDEIVT
jgi:hypothetical protein